MRGRSVGVDRAQVRPCGVGRSQEREEKRKEEEREERREEEKRKEKKKRRGERKRKRKEEDREEREEKKKGKRKRKEKETGKRKKGKMTRKDEKEQEKESKSRCLPAPGPGPSCLVEPWQEKDAEAEADGRQTAGRRQGRQIADGIRRLQTTHTVFSPTSLPQSASETQPVVCWVLVLSSSSVSLGHLDLFGVLNRRGLSSSSSDKWSLWHVLVSGRETDRDTRDTQSTGHCQFSLANGSGERQEKWTLTSGSDSTATPPTIPPG